MISKRRIYKKKDPRPASYVTDPGLWDLHITHSSPWAPAVRVDDLGGIWCIPTREYCWTWRSYA